MWDGDGCIKDVTVENFRSHSVAGIRIIPKNDGVVSNIRLSRIDLFIEKENRELDEALRTGRGDDMVDIRNVSGLYIDAMNVYAEDAVLPLWNSKFKIDNCKQVEIINSKY